MRQYLVDFFRDFEYSEKDSAYLLFAYDRIAGREDTLVVWNEALSMYDKSLDCDFGMIISLAQEVAQRLGEHWKQAERKRQNHCEDDDLPWRWQKRNWQD